MERVTKQYILDVLTKELIDLYRYRTALEEEQQLDTCLLEEVIENTERLSEAIDTIKEVI